MMRRSITFFSVIASLSAALLNLGCPPSSDCEVLLTCGPASEAQGTGGSGTGTGGVGGSGTGGSTGGAVVGFDAVAAGSDTTCAVHTDGTVWCWGDNEYGQLGNGMMGDTSSTPVAAIGITNATDVSTDNGSCAVAGAGLLCWGLQTGNGTGTFDTPMNVALGSPVVDVSVGVHLGLTSQPFHSCVVLNDGTGRCWGANISGSLGVDPQSVMSATTPVMVEGLSNAERITCGGQHTCALTGGQVRCWGAAVMNSQNAASHTPVLVAGIRNATMVSAGASHTCAVETSGTAKCWGNGGGGQLGDGGTANSASPVVVSSLSNVNTVASGVFHSCASLSNGEVWCWGGNEWGQLGDGGMADSTEPVKVESLSNAKAVSAGLYHSCAVLHDGRAFCWGNNQVGQLGNRSTINSSVPVEVALP